MVRSRFGHGAVAVRSRFGHGTVAVRSSYSLGMLPIHSWYGTLKVRSRLLFSPRRTSNLVHVLYDLLFAVRSRCGYSMGHKKVPVLRNTLPCNGNFVFRVHFRSVLQFSVFLLLCQHFLSTAQRTVKRTVQKTV